MSFLLTRGFESAWSLRIATGCSRVLLRLTNCVGPEFADAWALSCSGGRMYEVWMETMVCSLVQF